MRSLEQLVNKMDSEFFLRVNAAEAKYQAIWYYYKENMPACINNCKKLSTEIDGPQGIYWIGKNPKIFFIGKESFEWKGRGNHELDDEGTMALPLWFCFYQTACMPSFWKKNYYVINSIFGEKDNWYENLDFVAISNACKCYQPDIQWNLHNECNKAGYIFKEIEIINAPINVFYTKALGILPNNPLFNNGNEIEDTGIMKYIINDKVYYEMNHPSRISTDLLERLIEDITKELRLRQLL